MALAASCFIPSAGFTQSSGSFGSATFSAYVNAAGVLVRSNGVTSSSRTAAGSYKVSFSRPLSSCNFSVTGIGSGPILATGAISASPPTDFFVRTRNTAGTLVDAPYNVIIICGP